METIEVSKGDPIERIAAIVSMRKIRILVLGLPLRMDGSEGESAIKVRGFGEKLRQRLPELPLIHIDETLTTSTAAGKLRQAGRNAKQQKKLIDQVAAVEILNVWMGNDE